MSKRVPFRSTLACVLAASTVLSGCRLFTRGDTLARAKAVESDAWNEQAFDAVVGEESVRARESMMAFASGIGAAYIGKVKSRPDAPEGDALKSDFPEYLAPGAVDTLRKQLVDAMRAASGEQGVESAFEFVGCNKSAWENAKTFLNKDVTKLFEADYAEFLAADLPAGPEARAKCGGLIEAPREGKVVHYEFYVDGVPSGDLSPEASSGLHQYVQVRRVREGFSSLDFQFPPALFRMKRPLRGNVAAMVRPHTGSAKLGMQLLPAAKPFSKETGKAARRLLGLNLSGAFNDDPKSLADLSRQWFAGQVHAEQTKAAWVGVEAALVVVSAGNAAATFGALHMALASGAALSGVEIATLVVQLGAAGFGAANEILDMAQLKESLEMMDHGPQRKALDVSVMVINALGAGFSAADLAFKATDLLGSAYRVYHDSRVLTEFARSQGKRGIRQVSLEELKAVQQATDGAAQVEFETVRLAIENAQSFNAAEIARMAAVQDSALVRVANAYKAALANFPKAAALRDAVKSMSVTDDEGRLSPGFYKCQPLLPYLKVAGKSFVGVDWNGCVDYLNYKKLVLRRELPFKLTGEGLKRSFDECESATKDGSACRKRQLYCVTVLWSPAFYECVAQGGQACVMERCDAPDFGNPAAAK